MKITYSSARHASVVHNALVADDELQPNKISRTMAVDDSTLTIRFETADLRLLRTACTSMMEMVLLASQTVEKFG